MDGHALADTVAGADDETAGRSREPEVLRLSAQDRSLVHDIAGAERGVALDDGVGPDLGAVADLDVVLDDRERPHAHAGPETGGGGNDGGRVDHGGNPSRWNGACTSARGDLASWGGCDDDD